MRILAIDPGQRGGLALISSGDASVEVLPSLSALIALLEWHAASNDPTHTFIEKCQSFPKQGITSAFNYGVHFGELLGVVQAIGLVHTLVPPKTWTKVMHAGTKDAGPKARSLEAVRRLFPHINLLATERCKKPHDGMIDALLIAEYGRRQLAGVKT